MLPKDGGCGRIGFRRSQNVAYRPSCLDCSACISIRVVAGEFRPNATQRRVLKRNADLEVTACKAWATEEQYELLRRYLRARHPDGGMVEMDEHDFSDMVEQSPVKTYIVEYREPSVGGRPGRLVGACLTAVALPFLLRPSATANPSVLPLDYPRNTLIVLGTVAVLTAVAAGWAALRRFRPPRKN